MLNPTQRGLFLTLQYFYTHPNVRLGKGGRQWPNPPGTTKLERGYF